MSFDDLLGLTSTGEFTATSRPSNFLLTPRNTIQGGALLGMGLSVVERLTHRPAVWATAQFLSMVADLDPVELRVTVPVRGYNTTQARVVLHRDEVEIATILIALGGKESEFSSSWSPPPNVPQPDECEPFDFFPHGNQDMSGMLETRLAHGRQTKMFDGTAGSDHAALWCRTSAHEHVPTAAELAFIGDLFPLAFAEAFGRRLAISGLDNTIRFGTAVATGWVLIDSRPDFAAHGMGYGQAHMWAQDGTLLATASQSAILRALTPSRPLGDLTNRRLA